MSTPASNNSPSAQAVNFVAGLMNSVTYDTAKINVSPQALSDAAAQITSLAQDAANQIGTINTTVSELQLSWTGGSADLANAVNDRWQSAITAVFGTPQDSGQGILPRLADGLDAAAQNYSNVDDWVSNAFSNFASQLSSASSGGNPQSVLNSGNQTGSNAATAITETF